MALINQITQLREDSLSSLDSSHNYYHHTKITWRLLQQVVRKGHKFEIKNSATGDTVNESELAGLAQGYVTDELASATFQHFVSLLERFLMDLLFHWLTEYPQSLSGKQLKFQDVLDSADKEAIITNIVQKKVNGVAYKSLDDWFKYLKKVSSIEYLNQDQLDRLAEIKASRDVLVHNNGIANSMYVARSNSIARFADGEKLELPEKYHRESWQLIKDVVTGISDAAINKLGK